MLIARRSFFVLTVTLPLSTACVSKGDHEPAAESARGTSTAIGPAASEPLSPPPTPEPKDPPDSPEPRVLEGCDAQRADVSAAILALPRPCEHDADCVRTSLGCPFGCYTYLAKSTDTMEVERLADAYHQACGQCEYRCAKPREPACNDGVCGRRE